MITQRAALGAALAAAAVLWLAPAAAADELPRLVLCEDFASVDPAQVSFCVQDAQGAVLGGGVSPTADVLPTVVADPAAPGGWGLAFPEGWAGTAVMDAPALVAASPAVAPATGSQASSTGWWLGAAALLTGAAAAALGLRRRGTRTGAGEMGGAEGI